MNGKQNEKRPNSNVLSQNNQTMYLKSVLQSEGKSVPAYMTFEWKKHRTKLPLD